MLVDALKASEAARRYFSAVVGGRDPLGFGVQRTVLSDQKWIIECSYFEWMGASDRTLFRVEVDAQQGNILSVEAIPREH